MSVFLVDFFWRSKHKIDPGAKSCSGEVQHASFPVTVSDLYDASQYVDLTLRSTPGSVGCVHGTGMQSRASLLTMAACDVELAAVPGQLFAAFPLQGPAQQPCILLMFMHIG